ASSKWRTCSYCSRARRTNDRWLVGSTTSTLRPCCTACSCWLESSIFMATIHGNVLRSLSYCSFLLSRFPRLLAAVPKPRPRHIDQQPAQRTTEVRAGEKGKQQVMAADRDAGHVELPGGTFQQVASEGGGDDGTHVAEHVHGPAERARIA